MAISLDDLQMVILDCVKPIWYRREVRNLFEKILELKFNGYGAVYGNNVISVDQVDFFGTHVAICLKTRNGLVPLTAYKSVTSERCANYLSELPCLGLTRSDSTKKCFEEVSELVETAVLNKKNISYDYSWAKLPEACDILTRKNYPEFHRDLGMMMYVNYHLDAQIDEMIVCGVLKVKTDKFFEKMGFRSIFSDSCFRQKNINGDVVKILHLDTFSEHALMVANEYKILWDNRIVYSGVDTRESFELKLVG